MQATTCFNPRARAWARLPSRSRTSPRIDVSIHAPVRGRDRLHSPARPLSRSFNPRARAWARRLLTTKTTRQSTFQSTRPCVGATVGYRSDCFGQSVSIHAPVRGRDLMRRRFCPKDIVSIHAPVRGRDNAASAAFADSASFNPRARAWARQIEVLRIFASVMFQSTRPCVGATTDGRTGCKG